MLLARTKSAAHTRICADKPKHLLLPFGTMSLKLLLSALPPPPLIYAHIITYWQTNTPTAQQRRTQLNFRGDSKSSTSQTTALTAPDLEVVVVRRLVHCRQSPRRPPFECARVCSFATAQNQAVKVERHSAKRVRGAVVQHKNVAVRRKHRKLPYALHNSIVTTVSDDFDVDH